MLPCDANRPRRSHSLRQPPQRIFPRPATVQHDHRIAAIIIQITLNTFNSNSPWLYTSSTCGLPLIYSMRKRAS